MRILKRLQRSVIKRLPRGKERLTLQEYRKHLFQPPSEDIFLLSGKGADEFYRPAFDRIFVLLKNFRLKGDILEFGVFLGYTARLFAEYLKSFQCSEMDLYLFDSFAGLPKFDHEDLKTYEAKNNVWAQGVMAPPKGIETLMLKELQKVIGENRVGIIKGFFEDTLENFLKQKRGKKAAIVHLDCDLYSSSKHVLTKLFEYEMIQDGTIMICDDWMCSLGNPHLAQRKALSETLENFSGWQFEPYFNYGVGSQVFVVHDLKISEGKKWSSYENKSCCLS